MIPTSQKLEWQKPTLHKNIVEGLKEINELLKRT
jgi:hypothetical protein